MAETKTNDMPIRNLVQYGLSERIVGLFEAAGYEKVGDWTEFTLRGGRTTDVPGVSERDGVIFIKALWRTWGYEL
jgi:hypothetical protein